MLAEKGASEDFAALFYVNKDRRNFLTLLKERPSDYIKICGPFFLLSALQNGKTELVKWLIIERGVSPVFEIKKIHKTALETLLSPFLSMDSSERSELLNLLLNKGCKVTEPGLKGQYPLFYAISLCSEGTLHLTDVLKILHAGASPYTIVHNKYPAIELEHPLQTAYRLYAVAGTNPTCFGLRGPLYALLQYGAGLIRKDMRLDQWVNRSYDQIVPSCFPNILPNETVLRESEIVINNALTGQWILTVKDLSEMLQSFLLLPEDNQSPKDNQVREEYLKRIDQICQWVMDAEQQGLKVLAEGVVEAFAHFRKSYRELRLPRLSRANEVLEKFLPAAPVRALVFQYLEMNPTIVTEASSRVSVVSEAVEENSDKPGHTHRCIVS